MRTANLALKFLLELAAFAALAYTGAALADGPTGVVLAVVLPVMAIVVWGLWCAPRAARRLPPPARIPVELVVLGGSAVGLLAVGAIGFGVALLALVVINAVLLTAWHQWEA